MTANILNNKTFIDTVLSIQSTQNDKELHWYIINIILPDLPQIIETLQICSNLLMYNSPQEPDSKQCIEKGPSIKLPLSLTNQQDSVNGIITRDGPYITDLNLTVKNHYFNKHFHKLHLIKPMVLEQLVNVLNLIKDSIGILQNLQSIDKELTLLSEKEENEHTIKHDQLICDFKKLLVNIHDSKTNLQLPSDPNLVFPLQVTDGENFEPQLLDRIAVDFYLSQKPSLYDLKSLHRITEKPWCEIDANGKSFVDKLKEEMKNKRLSIGDKSTSDAINQNNNTNIFSNMMSHLLLRHKYDTMDYITRCITYNNMVVVVNKKFEVSTEDPILISCFTKLDSLESIINGYISSLNSFSM